MPGKKLTKDELLKELDNARRLLIKKDEELTAEAVRKYETVRDQSRTLDAFFDNTITPLVILDRDFNFIMVNPAFARTGRRDISQYEGKNLFDLFPPPAEGTKLFKDVVATKMPYQAVARPFRFPDQSEQETTYWDWTLVPILDRDGEVDFLVFSLVEVSEAKRAELRLIESHALLNALGQAQASYISDLEPKDLFDKLLSELLEITRSEYGFIGQILKDEKGNPYLKNFATTNIAWNKETKAFYEANKESGLEFYNMKSLFGLVITTGKPVISNDAPNDKRGCGIPEGHPPLNTFLGLPCYAKDKLVGMVAIANRPEGYDEEIIELLNPLLSTTANIIEAYRNDVLRKETEETLKKTEERFKKAQEIARLGHWKLDPATNKITGSDELFRIFDLKKKEVSLESFVEVVHPEDREFDISTIQRGLEKGEDWDIEHRLILKDGTEKTVHAIGHASTDETGKVVELIGTVQDITERKKAEEALQNYKLLFDNMTDLAYMLDNEGLILYMNEPFEKLSGFKVKEFVGQSFAPLFEGKDLERAVEVFKKTLAGEALTFELKFKESGIVCEYTSMPLKDLEGRIIGALGTARDITERKEAEDRLKTERERLFSILDAFPGYVYLQAEDYTVPFANKRFIDHYGDPTGKTCHELIWDRGKPCDKCKTFDVFKTKKPLEWISDHPERENVYQVYDYPFIDTDGRFLVLELSIDITKRREAEEALAVHVGRLDRLSELGMALSGEPGEVFENIVRMIGELLDVRVVCLSEIRGDELYFLSIYADGETIADAGRCALDITPCATVEESKNLKIYDHVMEKFPQAAFLKDYKAYSYCGFPSLDNEDKVVAVTCLLDNKPHEFSKEDQRLLRIFGQRIAMELERSKAMAEKKKSEELLTSIIDNSTTVIYVKDLEGRYLLINSIFEKLFHVDRKDIIGMTDFEIFSKDMAEAVRANDLKVLEANESIEFEEIVPQDKIDHTYISIKFPLKDSSGNPYAVCGISTDITERTRAEADHLKMQKLESIGVLAGGIAHDFNNLLTGILGNVSFSMMGLDPEDKIYARLKEAERASLIARDLTQQLLTFAKGGEPVMETHTIESLIIEPAELALRGSSNKCEFALADHLPYIEADTGQMSQVINNLVINADQAMPEGGIINVSAKKKKIDTNDRLPLKSGDYVLIQVADHGTGISAEHIAKVFDPYFTTKQKGSGLGLASVYSIVIKHGGHVELTSKIGVGTTFSIYLPVSKNKTIPADKHEMKIIQGHGRILVMDDEEIIRDLLSEFLVQLGYEALSVTDGGEAIKAYTEAKEAGKPFKAIIMDLTIQGGMGGKETIKLLLKEDPKTKAIVSSGYSNDPVVSNYREYGFSGYLNKPYKVPMLSKVLDDVINNEEE